MMGGRKGAFAKVRRVTLLPRRYGFSSDKLRSRLREMTSKLHRLEITPTIPVTGRTLECHPELRSELETVDPAIHGYRHVAYSSLSPHEQARDLDTARQVFTNHGLPVRGFRAPYLRANEATREILKERGFSYDSSAACLAVLDDALGGDARRLASLRYGELRNGPVFLPDLVNGLVELPVSLPDDEILVDGLGIVNSETIARILRRMVEAAYAQGSLLVLQIHPERFPIFADAVTRIGHLASDLGAWRATLSEIAERCVRDTFRREHPFVLAITGDVDAATLGDFASRLWGR